MSDSSWPHELQHARPPCPSPTPRVYPNPCPSSRWCHPTLSSSVVPFSSRPQSFPASGLFKWVSSSHQGPKYWSFSFNISPSNEHPGLISFRMDWLDPLGCKWMSLSIFEHTFIYKNSQCAVFVLWSVVFKTLLYSLLKWLSGERINTSICSFQMA